MDTTQRVTQYNQFPNITKNKNINKNKDLFCFGLHGLVNKNHLWPPGARAFFLHSYVLYNNI